jgi:hypothetical protein
VPLHHLGALAPHSITRPMQIAFSGGQPTASFPVRQFSERSSGKTYICTLRAFCVAERINTSRPMFSQRGHGPSFIYNNKESIMFIQKKSLNATKTMSCRTDAEMYQAMQDLGKLLKTKPSSLMRLAIADLLDTARDLHPETFKGLRDTYGI